MNVDFSTRSTYSIDAYRLSRWEQQLWLLVEVGVDINGSVWITPGLLLNPSINRTRIRSICREPSQSSPREVLLQRSPMFDCRPSWSNESGPVHLSRSRRGYSCWTMRTSAHKGSWKLWVKFVFNNYMYYIYKVVISVSIYVCLIITVKSLDQSVPNFAHSDTDPLWPSDVFFFFFLQTLNAMDF